MVILKCKKVFSIFDGDYTIRLWKTLIFTTRAPACAAVALRAKAGGFRPCGPAEAGILLQYSLHYEIVQEGELDLSSFFFWSGSGFFLL